MLVPGGVATDTAGTMDLTLLLKILGAVAALALGVWMGMPGRYEQSIEEIEEVMERGGGRRRKVKRHFTPLAWLQR